MALRFSPKKTEARAKTGELRTGNVSSEQSAKIAKVGGADGPMLFVSPRFEDEQRTSAAHSRGGRLSGPTIWFARTFSFLGRKSAHQDRGLSVASESISAEKKGTPSVALLLYSSVRHDARIRFLQAAALAVIFLKAQVQPKVGLTVSTIGLPAADVTGAIRREWCPIVVVWAITGVSAVAVAIPMPAMRPMGLSGASK
jgi:hypothetical protein